ncbi:MAG: polysulfide reductase NrfD [Myxococcales bacterium]|nr:polysulfide reductase NrfD [Myxococcales bacterium]
MKDTNAATAIQRDIAGTLGKPGGLWYLLFLTCLGMIAYGGYWWSKMLTEGFGHTGLMHPGMWGMMISSFVFWVGIAHSGTLISAILFLFRAKFRTAVYRSAEAMTVFAVLTAGLFPIIHLGRAWLGFWLFPYPNQRELWVNFRSPLVWDVFAISTYLTVSALFLYTGLVPDIAAIRDTLKGWKKKVYALLALGWRGTDSEWRRYVRGYLFFAALATPLVISVHSVVSWDFAMSITPGWHSTIFAPYFVAGAILSGVAMVITILVPLRKAYKLHSYVTGRHFDMLSRLLILTSLIVTYSYGVEFFMAAYGTNTVERDLFIFRATGDYKFHFWLMVFCNCVAPQLCFLKRVRENIAVLFVISLFVNVGMFLERFNIVATSLSHSHDPFAWGNYWPAQAEIALYIGSFGWFGMWFLLFLKVLPSVSLSEMKEQAAEEAHEAQGEIAHAA